MAIKDYLFNKKYRRLRKMIKNKDLAGIVDFIHDDINKNDACISLLVDTFNISYVSNFYESIFNKSGKYIINKNLDNRIIINFIIFNTKFKATMLSFDPNWYNGLSDNIVEYINASLINPVLDNVFSLLRPNDKDFIEYMYLFFDHTGFTKDFYDYLFSVVPYDFDKIIKNLLMDPNLHKNCSDLEIKLFKLPTEKLKQFISFIEFNKSVRGQRFDREDLPLYFDGKNFTARFYKEGMFQFPNVVKKDSKKHKQRYTNLEIAFINEMSSNSSLSRLLAGAGVSYENLSDNFFIENGKLRLKKEFFRKLYDELKWGILFEFNYNDEQLINYGLSQTEITLYKYYLSLETGFNSVRGLFYSVLKVRKRDIFNYQAEEVQRFINSFELMCKKLNESNSPEIYKFRNTILFQLKDSDNPEFVLNQIDRIFCKNNLPHVGKAYLIFKILRPHYSFSKDSSPILRIAETDLKRDSIIFCDLIKCAMGSNNRSIRDYLMSIKDGNDLFLNISNGNLLLSDLNQEQLKMLNIFASHLNTLWNNTKAGRLKPREMSGNIKEDINELTQLFSPTSRYDLPDRIVRSFCYFLGIKSFDEAVDYVNKKREYSNQKGRHNAERIKMQGLKLNKGDFIKGLGYQGMEYFSTILQNGSVAKEFLCVGADSDATPLDTDLSRVIVNEDELDKTIKSTISKDYGPIWFVIKNDDRLNITRDNNGENISLKSDKLEVFKTLKEGHYGIRTGFASGEIDYIIVDHMQVSKLLPQIKHEIALNGFYIPVVDSQNGELIYSPLEYDLIRKKMQGLKYYDAAEFEFSNHLVFDSSINEIAANIDSFAVINNEKKHKINQVVSKVLMEMGISFIDGFDYDISMGTAQLIDTGSTGRCTCTGDSSDFDYILRVDSNVNQGELRRRLVLALNGQDKGGAKLAQEAQIEGIIGTVDVDISIVKKSETNFYSTDSAIKDRLEQIRLQDEKKYRLVIANIIYAKEFLKSKNIYKPSHAGGNGLGGVGVENWILQNGGSFYDATKSFYDAAKNTSYEEFKKKYMIWDDGINYYTGKYDEFVSGNMTAKGYKIMVKALGEFLAEVKFEEKTSDNIPLQNIREISVEEQQIPTIDLHDEQKTL